MSVAYTYEPAVMRELEHLARKAIPGVVSLGRAELREDWGGVDLHYNVEGRCALQVRARFNRPAWATDRDVTFRTTEPAMIAAGTYAPLALFAWLQDGYAVAGKLVDVYRMRDRIRPVLGARRVTRNGDGTGFHVVPISELLEVQALLRHGDRDEWAPSIAYGNDRVAQILRGES